MDSRAESEEVYALRSADEAPYSVSIQVRAAPIERYLVYDIRRARCEERPLYYDFVGPRRRREAAPGPLQDERRHVLAAARTGWRTRLVRWAEHARQAGGEMLVPADVSKEDAHVQVEAVAHSYGSVEALRDVNLNVRSGDFMCLLGPSGCGKSTLLQALAGHVRPTRGVLTIDGKAVERPGPDRLLMFQEPALFPWMTVEQNLTFMLAERGLSRRERRGRAREYLRMVQLDGFEKSLPHQLSGGMKMRASLARALAMDPPVLLMDEPFGSLDSQTRARMHELVQRLWMDRKTTVVFVTHDVNEALLLATRVVLMAARPGRVAWDLDVRLPHPRDLDDLNLASLARRVRAEIGGDQAEKGESEWIGDGSYAQ